MKFKIIFPVVYVATATQNQQRRQTALVPNLALRKAMTPLESLIQIKHWRAMQQENEIEPLSLACVYKSCFMAKKRPAVFSGKLISKGKIMEAQKRKLLVQLQASLLASCLLSLAACGGGGGGGGDTPAPQPPAAGGDQPDNSGNTGIAAAPTLQSGTYWEFAWNADSTSVAQGSSGSQSSTFGRFKLTLGQPLQIEGKSAYPLTLSDDAAGNSASQFTPRWKYLAVDGSTLLGSADGTKLQPIADLKAGSLMGGGFFAKFGGTPNTSQGTFSGNYNQLAALSATQDKSNGGCQYLLGQTLCSDSSTTFDETEYFIPGVGPAGLKRYTAYSSSGGGFYTSNSTNLTLEIVGTSLRPTDGSTIKPVPWTEGSAMVNARAYHAAAVANGKIYVFGGNGTGGYGLDTAEVYDPISNSWSSFALPPLQIGTSERGVRPQIRPLSSFKWPVTINNKIYLTDVQGNIAIFDPATGGYGLASSKVTGLDNATLLAADAYHNATSKLDYVIYAAHTSSNTLRLIAYRTSDGVSASFPEVSPIADRGIGFKIVNDKAYILGGWISGSLDIIHPENGTWLTRTSSYDLKTGAWQANLAAVPVKREGAAVVELNSQIIMLGGWNGATLSRMDSFNPDSNSWQTWSKMPTAPNGAAAVNLNGKIYLIGGYSDRAYQNKVYIYTP